MTGFNDTAPYPTYEGVNVLMTQQSSRYLFKQIRKAKKGKECKGLFDYLNHTETLANSVQPATDFSSIVGLLEMLKVRAAFYCENTFKLFEKSSAHSKSKDNELFATNVQKMTKFHHNYTMARMAKDTIDKASFKDQRIKPVLETLLKTHCYSQIMEDTQALYETGMFSKGSSQKLDEAFRANLADLRPHMLHLVELE